MSGRGDLGSAAEEAARLLQAAEEWVRTRAGGLDLDRLLDPEHLATDSRECQVCPLCQAVRAARGVRPETVDHLLDAAASFLAAMRASVAPPTDPQSGRGPGIQRIDVVDGP